MTKTSQDKQQAILLEPSLLFRAYRVSSHIVVWFSITWLSVLLAVRTAQAEIMRRHHAFSAVIKVNGIFDVSKTYSKNTVATEALL